MKRFHKIAAVSVFAFSSIIYLMTVAPTLSFWDCGEFIACSYKMAVPHPPGAPLFLLLGRLFSMLPIGSDIAFRVNLISVFSSSFTVLFLYLSIVHLVREWKGKLENKGDWLTAIFSGVIGSLTFAFTHSFWFNSAESEVYAPSMLFTSLLVWLILVWASKSEEEGNERYLLMIAYMVGLALGVHLLNILAIPFVAMIYYYKKFDFKVESFLIMTAITGAVMLFIYPGMVKWIPKMAMTLGWIGPVLFFIAILWGSWWAISNKKSVFALILTSVLLISVGYSSYTAIYLRSGLNPTIDENNPENIENFIKYMEREQYGDHSILDRTQVWKTSPNGRQYKSVSDFVWNYQINKMYVRYFLWQFVGLSDDETNVDFYQLWALPLLLGLLGMYWQFRRDPKHALAVLALFVMTGIAIIIYLNQPDPQPRERDYSYVGSFFAFSIWVGLGFAGVMDLLKDLLRKEGKELKTSLSYAVFVVLLLAVPVHMLAKNYHTHNRSGNYVAWDYSYNMLMSCEPNAILFTNGDNDTFPLWYLQEVENIRKDVRIVNLSLLNTDWYILQLKDLSPKVPMYINKNKLKKLGLINLSLLSDEHIRQIRKLSSKIPSVYIENILNHLGPIPWDKQEVRLSIPAQIADTMAAAYRNTYKTNKQTPAEIRFKVKPAIDYGGLSALRTQDYMILNIITANRWKRPIYFAVTVPQSNMLSELRDYMRMDGLVWRLVPFKNWQISPKNLQKNLLQVYRYRNLDNPDVYYNKNILSLLQNYRSGFIQLAEYYIHNNDYENAKKVLKEMDEKVSPEVIPITNYQLRTVKDAFSIAINPSLLDSVLEDDSNNPYLPILGEQLLRLRQSRPAEKVLEKAYELNPANPRVLGLLLNTYDMNGNDSSAVESLEQWLRMHPNDKNAKRFLASIKNRMERKK